jgi:AcrR family transcriptional regulator
MARSPHPTKERLITITMSMMDGDRPDKVHIDEVLLQSGISKGSLYHHFEDFSELIEAALIRRFSILVDASIGLLEKVVHDSTDREEFMAGLRYVTRATQDPSLSANRFERARALGMAGSNLRFRSALAVEQDRLTGALEDLFRESQNRGWLSTKFNPHAGAVMIQAYTLGQVINDVSDNSYNNDDWVALIDLMMDQVFS